MTIALEEVLVNTEYEKGLFGRIKQSISGSISKLEKISDLDYIKKRYAEIDAHHRIKIECDPEYRAVLRGYLEFTDGYDSVDDCLIHTDVTMTMLEESVLTHKDILNLFDAIDESNAWLAHNYARKLMDCKTRNEFYSMLTRLEEYYVSDKPKREIIDTGSARYAWYLYDGMPTHLTYTYGKPAAGEQQRKHYKQEMKRVKKEARAVDKMFELPLEKREDYLLAHVTNLVKL